MERQCVFCGNSKVTSEHVWPDWLADALSLRRESAIHIREIDKVEIGRHKAPPITVKVKRVCSRCNNGWMSDLESSAKPFVLALVKGEEQSLDTAQQLLLAFWITKTAMMWDFTSARQHIPDGHIKALYDNRKGHKPLDKLSIVIGRYVGIARYSTFKNQPIKPGSSASDVRIPADACAYGITMCIGELFVQLFGHSLPNLTFQLQPQSDFELEVIQISPTSTAIVKWPPRNEINDSALDELLGTFSNLGPTLLV